MFGVTFDFAGRKDTIKAVLNRRRYAYWFNLWGVAPWGPKETDEDYIGRVWPCMIEFLDKFAKEDWEKKLKTVSIPACFQLKDMYHPLEDLNDVDSWEEAKWFYNYWSSVGPGARSYRPFKSWTPVVFTKQVFSQFPFFNVEDLQNSFGNQAYKAYLYYKREKLFAFKGESCLDTNATMNSDRRSTWVHSSYKNFPRGERTYASGKMQILGNTWPTQYVAKRSSFKVRWLKEYEEKNKSKWILTQIKKDLPSKIQLMGKELESINEFNSVSSQFYRQYMTTRSGSGGLDVQPLFDKEAFLKEHTHFPLDGRQGVAKAWTEQGFTFILADLTKFVTTMIHGDKVWDPEAIDKKTGEKGAYVEKPSATDKWISDPFWGMVKCYWSRKAPWGPTDDETKNCRPYDPQSFEAVDNRDKRKTANEPLTRPGWVYKDRSMNDQGVIKLVVPWDTSPGTQNCGDSFWGGLNYNPDYPLLGWYFNSAVQMTMQAADKDNKRVGPILALEHRQETEENSWMVPNMAQVPWKGDSRSCYLTFYEYMNAVEQDLLEMYMNQKEGAGGKAIMDFQYAKESIVEYCGYTHNLSDNFAIYYCDSIRLEADQQGNIHSFQPDFIGNNIKVPGDGEIPSSPAELVTYRNQVEHWKNNKATPAAPAQFDHMFKRGRKIQSDLAMFPAGYLLNELTFMYKEEVQIVLDKGESVHYPEGGFVGWYHNGEKATNLTELTTLRDICRRYGTVEGVAHWSSPSGWDNYNVIAILSDALEIVSDPADGHEYSSKIINSNQITEPVGRKKAFSNTLQIRNRLQQVWNIIDCSSSVFNSEPLARGALFPWPTPGTLGHGTVANDHTWAVDTYVNPPAKHLYDDRDMDKALGKSYGVFNTRYAAVWNTFVQVFEDLYPLKISDKANEVAELTLSDRKLFYGLVVKDLGLANMAVMSMFEPWIEESLAIVNLAQTGQITSAEAFYRLKILLRPFMKNYPAGYSITDLERTYLLSFRKNYGGPLNTGKPVKTSDARYLGINDGRGWLASERFWILNNATTSNHHRVKWTPKPWPTAAEWPPGKAFYNAKLNAFAGSYSSDCSTIMVGTKPEVQCEKLLGDVLYYLFNMSEIMEDVRTELVKKGKKTQVQRNTASIYIKNMGPMFDIWEYNLNRNPVSLRNIPAIGDSDIWDNRVKKRDCTGSTLFYRGM